MSHSLSFDASSQETKTHNRDFRPHFTVVCCLRAPITATLWITLRDTFFKRIITRVGWQPDNGSYSSLRPSSVSGFACVRNARSPSPSPQVGLSWREGKIARFAKSSSARAPKRSVKSKLNNFRRDWMNEPSPVRMQLRTHLLNNLSDGVFIDHLNAFIYLFIWYQPPTLRKWPPPIITPTANSCQYLRGARACALPQPPREDSFPDCLHRGDVTSSGCPQHTHTATITHRQSDSIRRSNRDLDIKNLPPPTHTCPRGGIQGDCFSGGRRRASWPCHGAHILLNSSLFI